MSFGSGVICNLLFLWGYAGNDRFNCQMSINTCVKPGGGAHGVEVTAWETLFTQPQFVFYLTRFDFRTNVLHLM